MIKSVLQDTYSQLAQDLILKERRNLKQLVEIIIGHGHPAESHAKDVDSSERIHLQEAWRAGRDSQTFPV